MPLDVKRKEGEPVNTLLYRFNKIVKQSGILKTVRKKQFRNRSVNKRKRHTSALYRLERQTELKRARKGT